jgi:hypothetical protein
MVTTGALGFRPCFPVTDLRAFLAHYEQLGFGVMRYEDGAEGLGPLVEPQPHMV